MSTFARALWPAILLTSIFIGCASKEEGQAADAGDLGGGLLDTDAPDADGDAGNVGLDSDASPIEDTLEEPPDSVSDVDSSTDSAQEPTAMISLGQPSTLPLSGDVRFLAYGDLMGDTQSDLVAFTRNGAWTSAVVYVQQSDHSFRSEHSSDLSSLARDATILGAHVSDMSDDGRNDLVVWSASEVVVAYTTQDSTLGRTYGVENLPSDAVVRAAAVGNITADTVPEILIAYADQTGNHLAIASRVANDTFEATKLADLSAVPREVTALHFAEIGTAPNVRKVVYVVGRTSEEIFAVLPDGTTTKVEGFPTANILMARFVSPGLRLMALTVEGDSSEYSIRLFGVTGDAVLSSLSREVLPSSSRLPTALGELPGGTAGALSAVVAFTSYGSGNDFPRPALMTVVQNADSSANVRFSEHDALEFSAPFSIRINDVDHLGLLAQPGEVWLFPIVNQAACSYREVGTCSWGATCEDRTYRIGDCEPYAEAPSVAWCTCYEDEGAGMEEVGKVTLFLNGDPDACGVASRIDVRRLVMDCGFPL